METKTLQDFLDSPEVEKYQDLSISMEKGFAEFVVILNIPCIDASKYEKLKSVLLSKIAPLPLGAHGFVLPTDASGGTKGFAFVHLQSAQAANELVEKLNNFKLDKNHTFRVYSWSDLARISKVTDQYVPPEAKTYKERPNPASYLLDSRGRDQYVTRHGLSTSIMWHDSLIDHEKIYSRDNWTDDHVEWSPRGTYLITFHRQGIIAWEGTTWTELTRFQHPNVRFAQFSPCEKYLMTYCYIEKDNPRDPHSVIFWDVLTGRRLRSFLGEKDVWPSFKWSFDGAYFARIDREKSSLDIFQSSTMTRVDKEGFVITAIQDFSWSPTENTLAYWMAERGQIPARLVILNPVTKVELKQKSIIGIKSLKMIWQDKGDFLAVIVEKNKQKNVTTTQVEIFRMREKSIPNETFEVKNVVTHFSWKPKSRFFAIASGDSQKPELAIHEITEKQIKLAKSFEKKFVHQIFWSPKCPIAAFAISGASGPNGVYEFIDTNSYEVLGAQEHIKSSVVGWDFSGRYFATIVTKFKSTTENAFNVYSVTGQLISNNVKERLEQFLWRPRPPSALTPEQEKAVEKDLKNLTKRYKEVDDAIMYEFQASKDQERQKLRNEWLEYLQSKKEEIQELANIRAEYHGNKAPTQLIEVVEEIEEFVEEKREVLAANK